MATVLPSHAASAPVPIDADLEGDESLAAVMHEMGVALAADTLIVAWHERDGDQPVLLFADGVRPEHHAAERALVEAMSLSAGVPNAPVRSEWRVADGEGLGGELTTSIPTEAGVVTITGRFERLGSASRVRARDAVVRLLPIVRPFVRLWAARRVMLSQVRGLTAAVNKSDFGVLLVNRRGQLLFVNAAAEALLAAKDGIRRQGRMLRGGNLADTLRLQATIESVITIGASNSGSRRAPVVALTRERRRPLIAAVIASEIAEDEAEGSAAIIYLCDPDEDVTGLIEPTCKLYGLSPVETRLACHLARGVSLTEAADAMHVREQTARSYLKQIFLKTGTKRQAELVWLMLKSSVRTTSTGFRSV